MKFLVTGANGFLGKHICADFDANHIDYRASVREKKMPKEFQTADLTRFSDWQTLFQDIDVVIHSAAKAHDMSGADGLKQIYTDVNTKLTLRLASEAKKAGVKRFIFISSIKVNGEMTKTEAFTAADIPAPMDDYGLSKLHAEIELMKLHSAGHFDVVIIRPCLIYGAGVKANFHNLIQLTQKGLPLPFASIHNKRSFVSVDNLIDLIKVTAASPQAAGQIFLVSDDADLSLPELIRQISAATGKKVVLVPFPVFLIKFLLMLIGRSAVATRLLSSLQVDIEKTKSLLNWKPPFKMKTSLQKMFKS